MEKIVIFGGSGMTGSCAVKHALKKGNFFGCLDNCSSIQLHLIFLIRAEGATPCPGQ